MYRMTGDKRYITDGKAGWEKVMRHHGQASGVFTGDETLSGLPPARGTETCTVVEIMNSAGEMFLTTGDVWYADRLEQIAYNALPAVSPPLVCASGGLLFGRLAELGKSMCSKYGLSSNAMVPITSELLPPRGCTRDDYGKAGPFSVERLKMDLSFVQYFVCANKYTAKSRPS